VIRIALEVPVGTPDPNLEYLRRRKSWGFLTAQQVPSKFRRSEFVVRARQHDVEVGSSSPLTSTIGPQGRRWWSRSRSILSAKWATRPLAGSGLGADEQDGLHTP
jgi:hypothetical protein